jgi:hypothetical protein
LCCAEAAASDFYMTVFGAVRVQQWTADDGRIGHAELEPAGQRLSLADGHPEIGVRGPRTLGGTVVSFVLSVPTRPWLGPWTPGPPSNAPSRFRITGCGPAGLSTRSGTGGTCRPGEQVSMEQLRK